MESAAVVEQSLTRQDSGTFRDFAWLAAGTAPILPVICVQYVINLRRDNHTLPPLLCVTCTASASMSTPCSISARPSTPNLTSFPVASLRTEPAVARRAANTLACLRYIARAEQVELLTGQYDVKPFGARVCKCLFGLCCASRGGAALGDNGTCSLKQHASKPLGS